MRVFVIFFLNARSDKKGIHTLSVGDRNKVLMFESEDDATRFALYLEAQDFPQPILEAIDSDEIEAFCRQTGYEWEMVEAGKLMVPPEESLEWKSSDESNSSSGDNAAPVEPATQSSNTSEMSAEELEQIRRQLEGLL